MSDTAPTPMASTTATPGETSSHPVPATESTPATSPTVPLGAETPTTAHRVDDPRRRTPVRSGFTGPGALWQYIAFLLLFVLGGATFIAVTPPGLNPDEPAHVYRAYQVAHGGLVAQEAKGIEGIHDGDPGGYIPTAWPKLFSESHFTRGFDDETSFRDLDWSALAALHEDGTTGWQTFTNTVQYPPVAYVPQAVALRVGEALGLGVLAQLELGRALGLLAVAGLLLAAARLTPVGRLAFFAVGLLPSVVGQAASFSADGVTIALCFLATALALRWALREGAPTWWRWVLLGVLFVAVALVKPTYAPIAVVAAVIPVLNPAARRLWHLVGAGAVIAIAAGVTLGWLRATSWVTQGVNPLNHPDQQRAFLLEHPLVFVKAVFRSIVLDYPTGLTTQKGEIWRGVFGSFSWLRAPLPMAFVILLVITLVLSMLVVERHERGAVARLRSGVLWRVVVVVAITIVVAGVCLALYVYYTEDRGQWLQGLQGRYFLPVVPAVMLLFIGGRLVSTRGVRVVVFAVAAVSLVAAIVTIDLHFYQSVTPFWG
ncbi:DUF2142 domain-containing protein [Curtobacterium sp. VKM Ac-2922]|uniref:DUF2142 domain-containing protein n=1 Tax=Curtobacterium sp. VKM Ac-2922 TaxID=2929475 RepID=UPI001FB1B84A|nr:DUF2142 domain-containing protein [Curtobacterium sp. VKM Ac-2922]MCJ1713369.1 DUF2142 domain-containing protein [Curtobacterium sp. VKM Ac-2922]